MIDEESYLRFIAGLRSFHFFEIITDIVSFSKQKLEFAEFNIHKEIKERRSKKEQQEEEQGEAKQGTTEAGKRKSELLKRGSQESNQEFLTLNTSANILSTSGYILSKEDL